MRTNLIAACVLVTLGLAGPVRADNELGVRAGGLDDFYFGLEWQTPARVGPSVLSPSLDFYTGDFDAAALNVDLRWDLLPLFDSGVSIYGKAGPTILFAGPDDEIGLSLTIAVDVGLRKGRSLQFEWRFGFGDIPDDQLGVALMFRL